MARKFNRNLVILEIQNFQQNTRLIILQNFVSLKRKTLTVLGRIFLQKLLQPIGKILFFDWLIKKIVFNLTRF